MRRGDDYRPIPEMMWKCDENLVAARRLPKWNRFHRACGEQNLFFDNVERRDRRDTYKCVAFTVERRETGKFIGAPRSVFIAEGTGKTVLEALGAAFAKAGYDIPEAAALLAAGLQDPNGAAPEDTASAGQPEVKQNPPAREASDPDDFDALMDSDFEELL